MIERFYEITCDVCGEPRWIESHDTVREWLRENDWRALSGLHICGGCWSEGKRWCDATLHSAQAAGGT